MNWFDQIGLTYAKNFDEVETARSAFTRQRQVLLDTLAKVCESALENTSFKPFERGKPEGGWETLWGSGKYASARKQAGTGERQVAVCFGFDHDPCFVNSEGGRFGFGAYLVFKMNKKRFEQMRSAIVGVGVPSDYYAEDSAAYLRTAWITPNDERFKLDAFEDELSKLPELFAKADEAIGHAYIKLKFG